MPIGAVCQDDTSTHDLPSWRYAPSLDDTHLTPLVKHYSNWLNLLFHSGKYGTALAGGKPSLKVTTIHHYTTRPLHHY